MRGASLRSVAELLGHQSMKMTMRYAHLSPAFLSAEVRLLDPPPAPRPEGNKSKRARKGQGDAKEKASSLEVPSFVKDFGSSGWTRSRSRRAERGAARPRRQHGEPATERSEGVGSSGWTRTSNPPVNSCDATIRSQFVPSHLHQQIQALKLPFALPVAISTEGGYSFEYSPKQLASSSRSVRLGLNSSRGGQDSPNVISRPNCRRFLPSRAVSGIPRTGRILWLEPVRACESIRSPSMLASSESARRLGDH
jgi:hypothetical protein